MKNKRNCAFQYYNGKKVVCDKTELTLQEAKSLFNEYYSDMVRQVNIGHEIECVIWIDMKDTFDYDKSLIWLQNPSVDNSGTLYEESKTYFTKF